VKGKDALHKTRLMLNILKKTIGVFLIPGSELYLDEASCASRSSYGRELICFNPAKNCGKFHFRFYLLCYASTFSCLTIKVATRNDFNPVDPEETLDSVQQEANYSLLNELVLEMCRKYIKIFRTVNIDYYYTSPAVLILLHNHDIYSKGTVKNRRMVHSQIVLTQAEIKRLPDGYVRMDMCEFSKMQAFGWNDSKKTHILSTADVSRPCMHVVHQLGSAKLQQQKFKESIVNHFIQAISIACEALYGNSILDLDSRTPGNDSDDDNDAMQQLGVLNKMSNQFSLMKEAVDM
jgi:hypothetical protein